MAHLQTIGYSKKPLVFKVTRRSPELITPAGPTPYEFKELSNIDDQDSFRFQLPVIVLYKNNNGRSSSSIMMSERDPAKVIKEAMAKALVPYYPFAGRLREKTGKKLVVECNGEGVIFIEADADVTLHEFGELLHPPFPCLEELLYDVPGSSDILHTPLILMQVTRLKCGGFIIALRVNHTMVDAQGIAQFLKAIIELASGAKTPSIPPVWERHLLSTRDPPQVTCEHRVYDDLVDIRNMAIPSNNPVQHKSFFFGSAHVATLRRVISSHTRFSTFEIISACLWRCYTIALRLNPEDEVRMMLIVNARTTFNDPPIPSGYYGNVLALQVASTTAANLSRNPISYALGLVRKAKGEVTQEYMKSLVDYLSLKGRPCYKPDYRTFVISDITHAQSNDLDFGWGRPVYVGAAKSGFEGLIGGFYLSFTNERGEKGILMSISLPKDVMELFVQELNKLLYNAPRQPPPGFGTSNLISSSM